MASRIWQQSLLTRSDAEAISRRPRKLVEPIGWVLLCGALVVSPIAANAAAPPRLGQPYAEATLCGTPNVIFCEDFNYPVNFIYTGVVGSSNSTWINPGLTNGIFGFVFGLEGRRINPATTYPAKPQGAMPSGTQPDHAWVANWNPALGAQGNGSTWGYIRDPGGANYANGTPRTADLHFRFQYYVTANYAWPGDPKTDPYAYCCGTVIDNKIFYIFPPEGTDNPTNSRYDAGLHTQGPTYYPGQNARFADTLAVRYGDTSDNYKYFPLCSSCATSDQFNNYGPFQSLTLRNPNDQKLYRRAFRFNTNRWYTIEMRYVLSSPGVKNGTVQVWVDGTLIYDQSNLDTCGFGLGDCTSGVGAILLTAYHNGSDGTNWNGQQVIDNLVISRSYIGPPAQSGPPVAPGAPVNLRLTSP